MTDAVQTTPVLALLMALTAKLLVDANIDHVKLLRFSELFSWLSLVQAFAADAAATVSGPAGPNYVLVTPRVWSVIQKSVRIAKLREFQHPFESVLVLISL